MLKEMRGRFAAHCGRAITTSCGARPSGTRLSTRSARQNEFVSGRFAPSPTGDLHVGNLRTALLGWLAARSAGIDFIVRMEDLDRVTSSVECERRQLADLAAIGLDWNGVVVRQSDRFDRYWSVLDQLRAEDLVYPCYCTRREIRMEIEAAAHAPHEHLPDGAYPGTCRKLTVRDRTERESGGRQPAWRLRTDGESYSLHDEVAGFYEGAVDDFVLARADGVPAYNLAVVVDDIAQGVTQIVRGDDLLSSTPRHLLLQRLLGAPHPMYAHVPLVVEPDGKRLAKRGRAVTLTDLAAGGVTPRAMLEALAVSLDLAEEGEPVVASALVERFQFERIPRHAIVVDDLFRDG